MSSSQVVIRNTETGALRFWPAEALEYITGWEQADIEPADVSYTPAGEVVAANDPSSIASAVASDDAVASEVPGEDPLPDPLTAPSPDLGASDTPIGDEAAAAAAADAAAADPAAAPTADPAAETV